MYFLGVYVSHDLSFFHNPPIKTEYETVLQACRTKALKTIQYERCFFKFLVALRGIVKLMAVRGQCGRGDLVEIPWTSLGSSRQLLCVGCVNCLTNSTTSFRCPNIDFWLTLVNHGTPLNNTTKSFVSSNGRNTGWLPPITNVTKCFVLLETQQVS